MQHDACTCFLKSAAIVTGCIAIAVAPAPACWGQVINEHLKLLPNDGSDANQFGFSVAVDRGIVAVGANYDDDHGRESGSAYLFNAATGAEITKLLPDDGAELDQFGFSIAIDKGVVAVGAPRDDDKGGNAGAAYLFDASTGDQITKLLADDGDHGNMFGWSIAIDNGVVAVGALYDDDNGGDSGSAYLFDASTGEQIAKLLPSDGAKSDQFGCSIAIDNGMVAVGALFDDNGAGAAYLFDAASGEQLAKLVASDRFQGDWFGDCIDIDDGIVVVGAWDALVNNKRAGAAYTFDASTGKQIDKLYVNDGYGQHFFGVFVAIDNGVVAVGSLTDEGNGSSSGAAYLFGASTGRLIATVIPSDGDYYDRFSDSIAMDNGILVAGSFQDDDNGNGSGSAYVFDARPTWECLYVSVEDLIARRDATFIITNGTPGSKAVTAYGLKAGQTVVNNYAGYCATFGIKGITTDRIIGGLSRFFDSDGRLAFEFNIPRSAEGMRVFFQSAQHGTCPNECMSNVVEAVVH